MQSRQPVRQLASFAMVLALGACEIPTVLPPEPPPPGPGQITGTLLIAQADTSLTVPAAGAYVQILSTTIHTTADSNGLFVLQPITTSTGELLIGAEPNAQGVYQRQRIFDLSQIGAGPGVDLPLGDVTLNPNGSITGKAVRGDMPNATTGQSDTEVFVPQGPFTTYTGDDGTYVLDNMPQGTLTLTFFRAGYEPSTIADIMLNPDQDLQLGTVTLAVAPDGGVGATGVVAGQLIFSPDVSNASLATGMAIGAQSLSFGITSSGAFSVQLEAGVYSLQFGYPGYGTATVPGVLVAPGTTDTIPPVTLTPLPAGADAGLMMNDMDAGNGVLNQDAGHESGYYESPFCGAFVGNGDITAGSESGWPATLARCESLPSCNQSAHVCDPDEVLETIENGGPPDGNYYYAVTPMLSGDDCAGWTTSSSTFDGMVLQCGGGMQCTSTDEPCNTRLKFMCCNTCSGESACGPACAATKCENASTCTDNCGYQDPTLCAGMKCDPSDNGNDTCGVPDTHCAVDAGPLPPNPCSGQTGACWPQFLSIFSCWRPEGACSRVDAGVTTIEEVWGNGSELEGSTSGTTFTGLLLGPAGQNCGSYTATGAGVVFTDASGYQITVLVSGMTATGLQCSAGTSSFPSSTSWESCLGVPDAGNAGTCPT